MRHIRSGTRIFAGMALMGLTLTGCGRSPEMVSTTTQETTRTMAASAPMMTPSAAMPTTSSTTVTRTTRP